MKAGVLLNPKAYLKELPDPGRETNKLHKLKDILMIVRCSLLSGINDWVSWKISLTIVKSGVEAF